jgi:hypothetical protein
MTERYRNNELVVGHDLRNEPRPDDKMGLQPTWGSEIELNDWSLASKTGGDIILKVNQNMLIIIQGFKFGNYLLNISDKPV